MNASAIDLSILGPAFLAGVLVLVTHVPLGREVLARGIIFIDLAVAQVAGLGVIAAHYSYEEPGLVFVQTSAIAAALAAALVLHWSEKRWPEIQEALIGVLFVVTASAGILLLAGNPHGGEHLKELLVGQILWVTPNALAIASVVYAALLAIWFWIRLRFATIGFYVVFAIAVTVSVQLVGIYLVFASLILPAIATRKLKGRTALVWGYAIGAVGYASGILLSAIFDLPTGAVTVCTLALSTAGAAAIKNPAGRRGRSKN